jgi:hypothetical protein
MVFEQQALTDPVLFPGISPWLWVEQNGQREFLLIFWYLVCKVIVNEKEEEYENTLI